jgi:tetratricopeptide (TPR) repeat protein
LLLVEIGTDAANASAERLGRRIAAKNHAYAWMPAQILVRTSRYAEALTLLHNAVTTPGIGIEDLRETCRVAMQVSIATDDRETLRQVDGILTAALAIEPNADEVLVMRAMLSHVLGKFEEEVRIYKDVLKHHPDSFVVLNNLAWALSEGLAQPKEALDHINKLVKTPGGDPQAPDNQELDTQARDTRGLVLSRLGLHVDAIRDLEIVVKNEPTALHHFHLARAYDRAPDRKSDARRSFDLALQAGLDPRKVDPTERSEYQRLYDLYKPAQEARAVVGKTDDKTP